MSISIMVESTIDDNEYESFPLGSYTGLLLQITGNIMDKLKIFPKLIEPTDFEEIFIIEGEEAIVLLINDINEILFNGEINISRALKEQLQKLLYFLRDKNFYEWKVYAF